MSIKEEVKTTRGFRKLIKEAGLLNTKFSGSIKEEVLKEDLHTEGSALLNDYWDVAYKCGQEETKKQMIEKISKWACGKMWESDFKDLLKVLEEEKVEKTE